MTTASFTAALRRYFASDDQRALQTALGLLWLLDGGLQLQPSMYASSFLRALTAGESGQPHWLAASIAWGARLASTDLPLWNTLFALTQVALGLGLLFRPTVKLALAGSFAWALVVWWFGEAFGSLFTAAASPLAGAPGAVVLYAAVGAIVWPSDRPGGLVGIRGARRLWAGVWALMAWLWLLGPNSSADATRNVIARATSGIEPVDVVQRHAADLAAGRGFPIALTLAAASLAIALAVGSGWQTRAFLKLSIYLSAGYWVVGQGVGGLATGTATDPNAAPLLVLFAVALWTLVPAAPTRDVADTRRQLQRSERAAEASSM